jgi:hypothetical protein
MLTGFLGNAVLCRNCFNVQLDLKLGQHSLKLCWQPSFCLAIFSIEFEA